MEDRRRLAERLEDILVEVIEKDELDAFSNYLLDVSSLTWQLEHSLLDEESYALKMEETKQKFMKCVT